jgi:hypothetical protein
MKRLALAALVLGAVASSTAFAHGRGGVHLGFHFGAPLFWGSPYWYGPPPYYYYYPPTVMVPASPPVYVERSDAAPEPSAQEWWYYCDTSRGYYPYVKTCPSGWQRVPPAPPPAQ